MKVISVKYKTSSTEVKAIDCFVDSGYLQGPGGSLPDVDVDFQSDRRQEVKEYIEVDCSFLGDKSYHATLFKDGVNAHRAGRDYKCESFPIKKDGKLKVHLAPGGGFALKIK